MKIRKGDTVQVISGKDKGKRGTVERVLPMENRVTVGGVNTVTRHRRASAQARQAGRVQIEAPIHLSNVLLVCPSCNKPSRLGVTFLEDGKKVRVCRKCQETIS